MSGHHSVSKSRKEIIEDGSELEDIESKVFFEGCLACLFDRVPEGLRARVNLLKFPDYLSQVRDGI